MQDNVHRSNSRVWYLLRQVLALSAFFIAFATVYLNYQSARNSVSLNVVLERTSGTVVAASGSNPIRIGDQINTVNNISIEQFLETVQSVEADPAGKFTTTLTRIDTSLTIEVPTLPADYWVIRTVQFWIFLTALVYVASGLWMYLHQPPNVARATIAYLVASISLGLMISGMFAPRNIVSALTAFAAWYAFSGLAHLQYVVAPSQFSQGRQVRFDIVYLFATVGYLLSVISTVLSFAGADTVANQISTVAGQYVLPVWSIFWAAIALLWNVRSYRNTAEYGERRAIGFLAVGSTIAVGFPLLLTLIPATLFGRAILPYDFSLSFLIVLPLVFLYAVRRHSLVFLDRYINRSATLILAISLAALLYTILVSSIRSLSQFNGQPVNQILELLLILIPAVIFEPLRKRLQLLFDNLIYGGWYDFQTVVDRVSGTLTTTPTLHSFAGTLSQILRDAMRLRWVGVLLSDPATNRLIAASVSGEPEVISQFQQFAIEPASMEYEHLLAIDEPIRRSTLRQSGKSTLASLQKLSQVHDLQIIAPLHVNAHHAFLLLGSKFGGTPFVDDDLSIMRVVVRQAGTALSNAVLVDELQIRIDESVQYRRQLQQAREAEGKRIAREIHDQLIQSLVSFKYRLAEIQTGLDLHPDSIEMNLHASTLQDELAGLIQISRQICYDLRPPTLDLGIVPALRSAIHKFQVSTNTPVTFEPVIEMDVPLEDTVELCLLRFLQESLRNIEKHAVAEQVAVRLEIEPNRIRLDVKDDGKGFTVPERLSELMKNKHFGMVGLSERASLLGGEMFVESAPGRGTHVSLHIPLAEAH